MRRKIFVLLILVSALPVAFTACTPDLSLEPAAPSPVETEEAAAGEPDQPVLNPEEDAGEEVVEVATGLTGQIQIAGSTTIQPLSEKLALAFMETNPGLVIEVQGGGSSVGVTAVGEGTVNIGQVSREIKTSEFEAFPNLQVFTIAFDGIAIVTHPDLELPSITLEQAKRIFGGEITNYAEVGGPDAEIIVVSREEGSGTRAAFDELVLESSEPELEMAETSLLQQSNGQVRTTVATTPNAIGYLSFGFLDESINLVEINGFMPTVDNVLAGNYPVFRPLNLTTNGTPDDLSKAFIDFILSNFGQVIVAEDYIRAR
jgi:phosphate transport system substrate-binding protein